MLGLIATKFKVYKDMTVPIIIMTGMALLFTYIFGIGFNGGYKPTIYIVDEEKSELTIKIVNKLKEQKKFNFVESSFENSKIDVENIDGVGVIYFTEGFTKGFLEGNGKIYFYKHGEAIEHMTITNSIFQIANSILSDIEFSNTLERYYKSIGKIVNANEIYNKVEDYKNNYQIMEIITSSYQSENNKYDTQKHYFAGFMLFFSLFIVTFGIGILVDEKTYHVFDRISVSPVSILQVIIVNIIVNFIISMGQLVLVMSIAKYLMEIDISGNLAALLVVLSMYVITGTSIGLFISMFAKNQHQLSAILPTLIVSTSMIGGLMWPLDIIDNKILLFLSNLVPQRWALLGVENIIIYNGSFSDIGKPVSILFVITIIFSIGTIVGYNKTELKNK